MSRPTKNSNKDSADENSQKYVTIEMVKLLLSEQRETMSSLFKESMSLVNERMDKIVKDISELKNSLNFIDDVTENKLKTVHEKIDCTNQVIKEMGSMQGQQVASELKDIKEKLVDQEDRSRRNNLRIVGIQDDENETWDETKAKAKQLFKN